MSDYSSSIRALLMAFASILFAASLFDALYGFKQLINPGISLVYNAIGTKLAPNMVTLVVFDWRAFDTLGESLILVTAVLVVLLIFGKGKIWDKNVNADVAINAESIEDSGAADAAINAESIEDSGAAQDDSNVETVEGDDE